MDPSTLIALGMGVFKLATEGVEAWKKFQDLLRDLSPGDQAAVLDAINAKYGKDASTRLESWGDTLNWILPDRPIDDA